jgi:uncharacterized membrane protein YgcG
MRTFPDVLAVLTQTAAHRREVGGQKTSKLCRPQFSPPLSLAVSVGVFLCSSALSAVIALDYAIGHNFAAHLDARHRHQLFSACASLFSSSVVNGDARTRRDARCSRHGSHRSVGGGGARRMGVQLEAESLFCLLMRCESRTCQVKPDYVA